MQIRQPAEGETPVTPTRAVMERAAATGVLHSVGNVMSGYSPVLLLHSRYPAADASETGARHPQRPVAFKLQPLSVSLAASNKPNLCQPADCCACCYCTLHFPAGWRAPFIPVRSQTACGRHSLLRQLDSVMSAFQADGRASDITPFTLHLLTSQAL